MNQRVFVSLLLVSSLTTLAHSQQPRSQSNQAKQSPTQAASNHPKHATHDHSARGPHRGEILEVGNEEYHVELCIDEAKSSISVYLLDKLAKSSVAIDAPVLIVNAKIKGKPVQIQLKPLPQEKDPKGLSSCFAVTSTELMGALHDNDSGARLSLKIGKKPYVVKMLHDHHHEHGPAQAANRDPAIKK